MSTKFANHMTYDDRNNLWVWPVKSVKGNERHPDNVWMQETDTWYQEVARNGYTRPSQSKVFNFTDHSMTTAYSGGYAAARFFDLEAGEYEINCKSDIPVLIAVMTYSQFPDGFMYRQQIVENEQNTSFELKDDCRVAFWFCPADKVSTVTISDISLHQITA